MAKSKLKERGRYYELRLTGHSVATVSVGPFASITANDPGKTTLVFWLPFLLHRFGQAVSIDPRNSESVAPLLALVGAEITDATTDRGGFLSVRFQDGSTVESEPSDYEGWELKNTSGIHVVGAVGRVAVF